MTNQEIIEKINNLLNERVFSSSDKSIVSYESESYLMKTNFKFRLSNIELSGKSNEHYFKVDSLEDVGKIWLELTGNHNSDDIDKLLDDAVSQFKIDLNKDLFLVIKIL